VAAAPHPESSGPRGVNRVTIREPGRGGGSLLILSNQRAIPVCTPTTHHVIRRARTTEPLVRGRAQAATVSWTFNPNLIPANSPRFYDPI
jgi:hypothetical protein